MSPTIIATVGSTITTLSFRQTPERERREEEERKKHNRVDLTQKKKFLAMYTYASHHSLSHARAYVASFD